MHSQCYSEDIYRIICWSVILINCFFCQTASAEITFVTPANGNGVAFNRIPEDTTSASVRADGLIAHGGTYPYTYTILSQDGDSATENFLFEISSTDVVTTTSATFDFETKSSYVLTIRAVDSAPLKATATLTLTVSISDVNDAPVWPPYRVIGCIAEDSVSDEAVIGDFTATDPDTTSPNNEIVSYAISGGNSLGQFAIERATGTITRTSVPLDISETNWYELQFEAVDNGTPAKTGTTTVYIAVGSPICCGTVSLRGNICAWIFIIISCLLNDYRMRFVL